MKLLLVVALVALVACGSSAAPPTSSPSGPRAAGAPASRPGQIHVMVGAMGSNTEAGDPLAPVLRAAVAEAFGADPRFAVDVAGTDGFHVDGVLTVTVHPSGRAAIIRCKVDLLVATYPHQAIFGLPSSTAEVGAAVGAAEVDAGRRDCVRAVAAELVTRHVIPMLRQRVEPSPDPGSP